MLHCPDCNRILMDKTADGWKLRTRMLLFSPKGTVALCPSCKTPVPVPVEMTEEPHALPKPAFFVNG